jgi:hypothetical protein
MLFRCILCDTMLGPVALALLLPFHLRCFRLALDALAE